MARNWRTHLLGSLAILLGASGTAEAQIAQRLVVLQSQDNALVNSTPVATKDIVAHLTSRSSGQGLPMVSIQSCAKVPADTVQGLTKELQAKKFIPIVDLNNLPMRARR